MIELNKNEWIEIPRSEYRKLKTNDAGMANSYTARICFKYFKKIKKPDKKYYLLNKYGSIVIGITIDIMAKKDIKDLMGWDENDWNKNTIGESELRNRNCLEERYKDLERVYG
jgi:hypothetical protein